MQERAMNRCECARLDFEEIARIAERERITAFEILCRRTGCASTCTGCRPDLELFLARRRARGSETLPAPLRMHA